MSIHPLVVDIFLLTTGTSVAPKTIWLLFAHDEIMGEDHEGRARVHKPGNIRGLR